MSQVPELSEENIASDDNTINNDNKILEIKEFKNLADLSDANLVIKEQLK